MGVHRKDNKTPVRDKRVHTTVTVMPKQVHEARPCTIEHLDEKGVTARTAAPHSITQYVPY